MSLKIGSSGGYVIQWQTFLTAQGFSCGLIDGHFGPKTDAALRAFQAHCMATPDGIVGTETFRDAVMAGWPSPDGWPLIQSKWYTEKSGARRRDLITIHTMEVPEDGSMEHEISSRFAWGYHKNDRTGTIESIGASAHFAIGGIMVVQNVLLKDDAWHAGHVNSYAYGLEHVGTAAQNDAQWADEFSIRMLGLSAGVSAKLCARDSIPVEWITARGLKAGKRGFTGHSDANDAFQGDGLGHRDPGRHFPIEIYLGLVKQAMEGRHP